ncbi:MAG: hypothetical protein KatS3mg113_0852 [Planctomycetaceae bacterium]|nr:MAG: hypothetical protein KatS3mg113_0852 [Planctomycetaceae bacterium]
MPRSIVMGWLIVSLSVMLIILGRNAQAESSLPPTFRRPTNGTSCSPETSGDNLEH